MNTQYPMSNRSKPKEAELAQHSEMKPHYRPNTIGEHIHDLRKQSQRRRDSLITAMKKEM